MGETGKPRGPWVQRVAIIFLSVVLGVLLFWLLGFVTKDIASMRGPDFSKVQANYVDAGLVQQQKSLKENLDIIKKDIGNKREQQAILRDSTDSLRNTMSQLLSIQQQSIERSLDFSAENQQTLAKSQELLRDNESQYQALNREVGELTSRQHESERELASVSEQVDKQLSSARQEYNQLMARHRLKVAVLQLAVMVPIFLISAWFFMKKRSGTYGPIVCAAFIAVFVKISLIVHEHFPTKYLKYVALLVVIGVVLKLLVYLIRRIVSPKRDWILRQYQEAYDRGICAVCGKPVRIGPLRYAMRPKRGSLVLAGQGAEVYKQQVYICPSCGTQLYEKCDKCSDIRHSLLPFCEHCGNEKADRS